MKKCFFALISFAVLMLVSCNKEEKSLIGKWQLTRMDYQEYEGGRYVEGGSTNMVDWYFVFEFENGGTGLYVEYTSFDDDVYPINWTLMGNKLSVVFLDEDSMIFTLKSVNNSKLVLSEVEEYMDDGIKCQCVTTYTFKKI